MKTPKEITDEQASKPKAKPKKQTIRSKEKKRPSITTSFIQIDENRIAEQLYIPEKNTVKFVIASKKSLEFRYVGEINIDGTTYLPILDDSVTEKAVLLPSMPQAYTSTEELLKEIKDFIYKYCDVSSHFLTFSAWYVLLSWVYDKFHTIPYLRQQGDTGTGKTRLQNTIGGICYKPCFVAGAVRPAPIYRLINQWKGTLIIDEADFKESDEYAEIVKILNCGFQSNMPIIRCKQNDVDKLQYFNAYCPKLIATRRDFKDKALESRCLTEKTEMTEREDIPVDVPKKFWEEQMTLRNKLLSWRLSNWFKIDPDIGIGLDLGKLEPRLRQATGSFASLFANVPEVLDEFKSFLKEYQKELIADRANSFDGMVVNALGRLLAKGEMFVSSSDICKEIEDFPDLKPNVVARRYKSLSIKIKPRKVDGKTKKVVVVDGSLVKVFRRYVDDPDLLNKLVTLVTTVTIHNDSLIFNNNKDKKQEKVGEGSTVCTVTTETIVTESKPKEKEILKKLLNQKGKPEFEIQQLLDMGISDKLIKKLKEVGEVFEPRSGFIKAL